MRWGLLATILFTAGCSSVSTSQLTRAQQADLATARTISVTSNFETLTDVAVSSMTTQLKKCGRNLRIVTVADHPDIRVDYQLSAAICVDCDEQPAPGGFMVRISTGEGLALEWSRVNIGCVDWDCITHRAFREVGSVLCRQK
jgi:hypothetical protein